MRMVARTSSIGFVFAVFTLLAAQGSPAADKFAERLAELEKAHSANPGDFAVLDALAGSYAMNSQYGDAIPVVQEMLKLRDGNSELILRLAKLFAWNRQTGQALEQLHRLDLTHNPEEMEFKCQTLTAAPRPSEAASCYKALRQLAGDDSARAQRAELGEARNQLWSGNRSAARRSYEEYLRQDPLNRNATVEYIKLLQLLGDYDRAESICNQLLQANQRDAEILALKAEILFWVGNRGFEARRSAERAVALAPDRSDARVALIATLAALGLNHSASKEVDSLHEKHTGESKSAQDFGDMATYLEGRLETQTQVRSDAPYSVYNDSDGIHNVAYQAAVSVPIRADHSLGLNIGEFVSSAPEGGLFTAGRDRTSVREFSAGGTALISPGLHVSLQGGGSMLSGSDAIRPTYNVTVTGSLWDRWAVALSTYREFLKVTPRAMDHQISSYGSFGDLRYFFDSRTSADIKFDRRWWSDGNHSIQADAVFSRNLLHNRRFNVDGGGLAGYQAFARDMLATSGFFTPDRYSRYDGFLDAHGELKNSVIWELRGEGGTQQITSSAGYQSNWAATSRLSIKISGSLRLYGSYERRNYSLLSRDGWYQGFYVSLGIQP